MALFLFKYSKYKTPVGATILQLSIAVVMMLFGNPDRLSDIAIFAVFMFYGLALFAVFLLRRQQIGRKNLYKVPFYPSTPIVAVIGAIYVVGSTLISKPLDALLSIWIALIGLPVYALLKSKKQRDTLSKVS